MMSVYLYLKLSHTKKKFGCGVLGTRIGRVKVIFSLPPFIDGPGSSTQSPTVWPKIPLAYIEWYTRQGPTADKVHGMYRISKAVDNEGHSQGAIIPLSNIRQGCMLFPSFRGRVDDWNSENVLDECNSFFINNWLTITYIRHCTSKYVLH